MSTADPTTPIEDRIGPRGVWWPTDAMPAADAAEFAAWLESLGYGALWIPETLGRDPFAHAAFLLANTSELAIATGIASIFNRHPHSMRQAQNTLAEQSGGRFLLGAGVSHAPIVAGVRKLDYSKPLTSMREHLQAMSEAMYMAPPPASEPKTVVAALGPKMLELAASAADGGSDRLIDALVPWGTADQIEARVAEHVDAGATHVCLQPLKPAAPMGEPDRAALEALAPR